MSTAVTWKDFRRGSFLAPVDRHLGDLLHALSVDNGGDPDIVAVSGALASAMRREGHVCFVLGEAAGALQDPDDSERPDLPPLQQWESALRHSPLVGAGDTLTPLVLDEGGRLYLRRFHRAERRLSDNLRLLLASRPRELTEPEAARFDELFPPAGDGVDYQALAALAAARHRFSVITGGPGTGKTTTVARVLALLLHRQPGMRVALCAPTGKAAARMGEALAGRLAELGVPDSARKSVGEPRTLHRLLGYHPLRDDFRRGPDHPLPADLVIVDEASMVDLAVMDALVSALPQSARLVLLGDHGQLASIAPGRVLGDLCAAARPELGPGPGLAAAWKQMGRGDLPDRAARDDAGTETASVLADVVVRLQENYRFGEQPGIGAFANALAAGRMAEALEILAGGDHDDLRLLAPPQRTESLLDPMTSHLDACLRADGPAAALESLDRFRVLCAVRAGARGVDGVNRRVEARLTARGRRTERPFYRGRPILVTANEHGLRLYNGDLGVCWPTESGHPTVWFRDEGGGLRSVSAYRLPPHETAWATTVHKSQGSEADEVMLVLPEDDRPICTAELVYTAVTRARRRARIVGELELLRAALGRRQRRTSGLGGALRGIPPGPETGSGQ